MSEKLVLGTSSPANIMAYAEHGRQRTAHAVKARKLMAMSSHPSAASRREEFTNSAVYHAKLAQSNWSSMNSVANVVKPVSSFMGRSENFDSGREAAFKGLN